MQAGTAGDTIMRIVTQKMSTSIGQTLVIQNVPDAAGLVGEERIAHAGPDGYTIGAMGDSLLTVLPHLQRRLHVDPNADFDASGADCHQCSGAPSVCPGDRCTRVRGAGQIAPGCLDFASGGVGSQQHMAMEMFMEVTGARLTHIPLRGAAQAAMEVVSGRIPATFVAISIAMPFIRLPDCAPLAWPAGSARRCCRMFRRCRSRACLISCSRHGWESMHPGEPPGRGRTAEPCNRGRSQRSGRPSSVDRTRAGAGIQSEELAQRTRAEHARMGRLIRANGIKAE